MSHKHVIWCDEETLSKNITGKIYIVTGAISGVGLETTKQLIKQGGWPMKSPNPHANDLLAAKQLVEKSYQLVGLK